MIKYESKYKFLELMQLFWLAVVHHFNVLF